MLRYHRSEHLDGMDSTPLTVEDELIRQLAQTINSSVPFFVPCAAQLGCRPSECFKNVSYLVASRGGNQVFGWAIWQTRGFYVRAENHAIWQMPDGKFLDPTPQNPPREKILFLRDDDALPKTDNLANMSRYVYDPINRRNKKLVELFKSHERLNNDYRTGKVKISKDYFNRANKENDLEVNKLMRRIWEENNSKI